jgi:hypothetical protein
MRRGMADGCDRTSDARSVRLGWDKLTTVQQ